MTNEQAKSELMQIYGMLSEEKKQAIDVLMAQNCDQCEVGNPCLYCEHEFKEQADNIPVMYYPQVDGITPTVVAQADGEKTCGTCRNEDTYHCAECENKSDYERAQADGEYISKDTVIEWLKEKDIIKMVGQEKEARKQLDEFPSVAIPPDHDGCKDCRWQSQSETEMPCKQCMHNYTDEWERAKIGHWVETGRMFVEPNDDQILYEYICDSCKGLAYFRKSMDDLVGAKYCPCCNSPMEIER